MNNSVALCCKTWYGRRHGRGMWWGELSRDQPHPHLLSNNNDSGYVSKKANAMIPPAPKSTACVATSCRFVGGGVWWKSGREWNVSTRQRDRRSEPKRVLSRVKERKLIIRLTILGVVHRDLEPFRGRKLLTVEVLVDPLVHSIREILAVEWHTHDEEARAEYWLSLGELDLSLVGVIGREASPSR